MGIQGLLSKLSSIIHPVHIKEYSGTRIAVDAYVWLHRGAFSCASELCQNIVTDKYIRYCMSMIKLLRAHNIAPVLVFDGADLPSKKGTEAERRRRREENKAKAAAHLVAGEYSLANDCFQRAVNISLEMAHNLISVLKKEKIEFIVAPYEADAQLAYLSRIGYVDAIITEDSDLVPYGASRILYKLDRSGNAQEYKLENLAQNFELDFSEFTRTDFRRMCILSGCDYLDNIPGVGLKKAYILLKKHKDMTQVFKAIQSNPRYKMPPDYESSFRRADNTFLHQRVWDPFSKRVVPLVPIPEDVDENLFPYIGRPIDPETGYKIATGIGQINPETYKPYFSEDSDSILTRSNSGSRTSSDVQLYLNSRAHKPMTIAEIPQSNTLKNYFIPTSDAANRTYHPPRSKSQGKVSISSAFKVRHKKVTCKYPNNEKENKKDNEQEIENSSSSRLICPRTPPRNKREVQIVSRFFNYIPSSQEETDESGMISPKRRRMEQRITNEELLGSPVHSSVPKMLNSSRSFHSRKIDMEKLSYKNTKTNIFFSEVVSPLIRKGRLSFPRKRKNDDREFIDVTDVEDNNSGTTGNVNLGENILHENVIEEQEEAKVSLSSEVDDLLTFSDDESYDYSLLDIENSINCLERKIVSASNSNTPILISNYISSF